MNQSKSPRQYQRRNYYIDKKFQTKFIIQYWLIVAMGSLLTVAAGVLAGPATPPL